MNLFILLKQTVSLGPLNLPGFFIPLVSAWIIYQVLIKLFYRGRSERLKLVDGVLFTGLFIVLIVWKLSPVLFQFNTVISNPAAILYLPGGAAGGGAGISAAGIYYFISFLRYRESKSALLKDIGFNAGFLLVLMLVMSIGTGLILKERKGADPESLIIQGAEAPGFSLEAEDGRTYTLGEYAGRTVVLNFWASWCPPCRAELPELIDFFEGLDSSETVFLSINLFVSESEPDNLPAFIKEQGLSFPVLYDKSGQTADDYQIESIPTTIIIDGSGLISAVRQGAVTEAWLKRAVGMQE